MAPPVVRTTGKGEKGTGIRDVCVGGGVGREGWRWIGGKMFGGGMAPGISVSCDLYLVVPSSIVSFCLNQILLFCFMLSVVFSFPLSGVCQSRFVGVAITLAQHSVGVVVVAASSPVVASSTNLPEEGEIGIY